MSKYENRKRNVASVLHILMYYDYRSVLLRYFTNENESEKERCRSTVCMCVSECVCVCVCVCVYKSD